MSKSFADLTIPPEPRSIIANRDPTNQDVNFEDTIWVSHEYMPYRVFRGAHGKWVFLGKFYPVYEK